LKLELKKAIKENEDSVIFYILRTTKYSERQTMGIKKGGDDMII
jgi:CRISPR-associated protein Cas2